MIQALVMVGSCLAALVVLLAWAPQSEHRPRHADAGVGALTVWQLRAQIEREQPEDSVVWPTTDPDAPGRSAPDNSPVPIGWAEPSPELLRRVLDALHRL